MPLQNHSPETQLSSELALKLSAMQDSLGSRLIGHEALIQRLLIAVIANGHILIEGAPGLAKTRAVTLFAKSLDANFSRIQSTPDLLPADITGTNIYQQQTGKFEFVPGPLFNNVVLVDEINRSPPKVQSALLEAMAEQQITTAGNSRKLEQPFMVIATQNSLENEGTYPLPEAQLDRFMFYLNLELPDADTEGKILDLVLNENRQLATNQDKDGNSVSSQEDVVLMDKKDLLLLREQATAIHLSAAVREYIIRLVDATRNNDIPDTRQHIRNAASPRGSIALATAAQVLAMLEGREHVLPEDVQQLAADTLGGRIGLSYRAQAQGMRGRDVINMLMQQVAVL